MRITKRIAVAATAIMITLSMLTACGGIEIPGTPPAPSQPNGGSNSQVTPPSNSDGSNAGTSSGGSQNNAGSGPSEAQLTEYRKEVLKLINEVRAQNGVAPLEADNEELTAEAQRRSKEIVSDFTWKYCTEQVAAGSATPQKLVSRLAEKGSYLLFHDERLTKIGIGYTYAANSQYIHYWDLYLSTEYYPESSESTRTAFRQRVLDVLNQKRRENSLPLLTLDEELTEKVQDCSDRYAAGESANQSYTYYAGCNAEPEEFAEYLMQRKSSELLDANYTRIGIGFHYKESRTINRYWTAAFEKNSSDETNSSTETPSPTPSTGGIATDPNTALFRQEVLRLVNVERAKRGLSLLTMDNSKLTNAALLRTKEITQVYSHTRPNGKVCFTALDEYGVDHGFAGENIAAGQKTPEAVVNGWMNSPGHRANILNPNYKKIGIGYMRTNSGYKYYWVQMFTD